MIKVGNECLLVRCRVSVSSSGKADTLVGGIVHAVEAFPKTRKTSAPTTTRADKNVDAQEDVSIGKVKTLPRRGSNVADHEIDSTRVAPNLFVECTRPNLRVRRQVIGSASDIECQRLQVSVLFGGKGEEAGVIVHNTPRHVLIFLVGI